MLPIVAGLLATRQTILICQDAANKSATTWQQVVVVEFRKQDDTTDFYPRQLVTDLLYGETGVMYFGLNFIIE